MERKKGSSGRYPVGLLPMGAFGTIAKNTAAFSASVSFTRIYKSRLLWYSEMIRNEKRGGYLIMYLAHISEDGREQTAEAHLRETAELCGGFAAKFGEEKRGRLLGLTHDIGKNSQAFQKRLHGGAKVDHATAGALECAKIRENLSACCVIGHHSGLPDFGNPGNDYPGAPTCMGRLKKGKDGGIPPYEAPASLPEAGPMPKFRDTFTLSLWVRMLYSCLVDGDFLDTEAFMSGGTVQRQGYDPLETLLERLNAYIAPWFPGKTELNRNRCAILSQCLKAASQPRGVYSLTVPTGGGKTVSSLAFALKHAVEHGLDRVIYVVPYTSIIEQNADVFRGILGENNVVEHHSGVTFDEDEETNKDNQFQRLAAENWDAPVIVTTAVQFFESLYANRSSQCRKLHNIANSVIVFDEAQMIPMCHLTPCVGVMANLAAHFRATVVLCTATQPVLGDLFRQFCPELEIREICPDFPIMFQKFRRVTYRDGGTLSLEALAEQLSQQKQVLCIVNTRKEAQDIYALLPKDGSFHLSTLMYSAHRKAVLDEIRKRLKVGLPCRVVSTSLIEAGVDVDFPAVYRELAGLDSIAQAAGRCNREGKNDPEESIVTYFRTENPIPLLQRQNTVAAASAMAGGGNPGNPETMKQYFSILRYNIGENTDKSGAVDGLRKGISGCALPFETVAKHFHLIEDNSRTVYIPLGEGKALCDRLLGGFATKQDYRRAGQYSVSVYENHYRALYAAGALQPLNEDSAILTDMRLYDSEKGLSLAAESGQAFFA